MSSQHWPVERDPQSRIPNLETKIKRLEAEAKRMRAALAEIRDGYGPNHGSKFCRDTAAAGLNEQIATKGG